MSRAKVFFAASGNVTDELGRINNSIWSSAVGLWILRREVGAFVKQTGKDSQEELHERFVAESGVVSADLRTTCLKWSWDEHRAELAKSLLFQLCALYEGWLEDVVPRSVPPLKVEAIKKELQFPTVTNASGQQKGFRHAVTVVNEQPSRMLRTEFFPVLASHRKNSWFFVEELLIAYRYFKECRNAFIHGGGVADGRIVQAQRVLRAIAPHRLGLAHALQLPVVTAGKHIQLALPDVVALSGIVHRLIITVDAALAVSAASEDELLQRLGDKLSRGRLLPKKDMDRRHRAIKGLVRKAGLPEPRSVILLEQLMQSRGLA
jgi:hypothetical protein